MDLFVPSSSSSLSSSSTLPFIEKYRPQSLTSMVLGADNRYILEKIVMDSSTQFPHLFFYGPPGTGKTTSAINLIHAYFQRHHPELNRSSVQSLIIHLNASDDRGIDVIRNQIDIFIRTGGIFHQKKMKFVILDEAECMTATAQQALRTMIRRHSQKARFCLICNYISKVDEGLQNECIRLRFHALPPADVELYLKQILENERIVYHASVLSYIVAMYGSDLRSMINHLQYNADQLNEQKFQMKDELWEELCFKIKMATTSEGRSEVVFWMHHLNLATKMDAKSWLRHFFRFLLRKHPDLFLTSQVLRWTQFVLHLCHPVANHHLFSFVVHRFHLVLVAVNNPDMKQPVMQQEKEKEKEKRSPIGIEI